MSTKKLKANFNPCHTIILQHLGNNKDLEDFYSKKINLENPIIPSICYFGDGLKSDVINCSTTAKWNPVYLLEELLLQQSSNDVLGSEDSLYLKSDGVWDSISLSNTLMYSLALEHASLILPTLESISSLPLDHHFVNKINL